MRLLLCSAVRSPILALRLTEEDAQLSDFRALPSTPQRVRLTRQCNVTGAVRNDISRLTADFPLHR